jgi:hypothetical protein
MAKKVRAFTGDRTDPTQNKSLAIRTVLKTMPTSKANDVAAEVKKQFGHAVSVNQIYMIRPRRAWPSDRSDRARQALLPAMAGFRPRRFGWMQSKSPSSFWRLRAASITLPLC